MRRINICAALLGAAIALLTLGPRISLADASPQSGGQPDTKLVDDLVAANHILADLSVLDGFGHVSFRSDKDPNRYFMSRSLAPELVTAADIMEFDLEDNAVDPRGRAVYLERFIHGAIYKARPDVKAIVHDHPPALIAFSVSTVKLQPIYHMGSFLGGEVPVFEIRPAGGMTDMLVRNLALGEALAKALGDHPVVLMRGHGAVVVGSSLPQATFRAVYSVENAKLQAEAMRYGPVTYLAPEEAAKSTVTNDGVLLRAWDLWKRKVTKAQ
jgi:HCOMODA/2-hydroxy-3-carboxy-muconic semialdehyde decarboxylase